MDVITNLSELRDKIVECNDVLVRKSDDEMRRFFNTFRMEYAETPADPFSPEYRAFQMQVYEAVAGKPYAVANERSWFDVDARAQSPFPYYLGSTRTAGNHLMAIGFMLASLDLKPGARILEFGPGWGNTTIELARLGFEVTAVDVDPGFCELIRRRAARMDVSVDVVEGDFFWAEQTARPFDAVLFFECFHHCDDHMRLLRALHNAVAPGGRVYLASEPVVQGYQVPWGVRMDGVSLWAVHNFGWLELGFDAGYLRAALGRTGWHGTVHPYATAPWASVWSLERSDGRPPDPSASGPGAPPAGSAPDPRAEQALRELEAVYASTSWRLTKPLRELRRIFEQA